MKNKLYTLCTLALLFPLQQSYANEAVTKQAVFDYLNKNPEVLNSAIQAFVQNDPTFIQAALNENQQVKTFLSAQTEQIKKSQNALDNLSSRLDDKLDSFTGENKNSYLVNTGLGLVANTFKGNKQVGEIKDQFNRHVYLSTTAGYQWSPSSSKKAQESTYDFSQKDNLITNLALGVYFNRDQNAAHKKCLAEKSLEEDCLNAAVAPKRGFALQGEYQESRTKTGDGEQLDQKTLAVVGLVPILPKDISDNIFRKFDAHVYGIAGAGYSTLKGEAESGAFEDARGIVGIGYSKDISNTKAQIVGEARAIYSMKENYWQPQVMAGIRVGLGQYMSKYLP